MLQFTNIHNTQFHPSQYLVYKQKKTNFLFSSNNFAHIYIIKQPKYNQTLINKNKDSRQRMSQDCIQYQQYKKITEQKPSLEGNLHLSTNRVIIEQNKLLIKQLHRFCNENMELKNKIRYYRNICASIIDAVGRVFSGELAKELQNIMEKFQEFEEISVMSNSIYQAMASHQSQHSVTENGQNSRVKAKTPDKRQHSLVKQIQQSHREKSDSLELSPEKNSQRKSLSRSPFSSILTSSIKHNDPSTSRSQNTSNRNNMIVVATGINCEICDQTFAPNHFIEHAQNCKDSSLISLINQNIDTEQISEEVKQIIQIDLQDTQAKKLKKESNNYLKMMKNLMVIQNQIEQQIEMLKISKEKIDRESEKKKLENDLAKVMFVIEQKKKLGRYSCGEKGKGNVGGGLEKSGKIGKKKMSGRNRNL